MTTTRYRGFRILARPYQLFACQRWTVDLEIRRNGWQKAFSAGERYRTEQEAVARCAGLGRRIIDGGVPGWSVDRLRGAPRGRWAFVQIWKGGPMRLLIIAGIVILGLGAFVLLRGASFTSRRSVLAVGDLKVTATEQQSIPPWIGGAAMLVGAGLLVAGMRKRA